MTFDTPHYRSALEQAYCQTPADCRSPRTLIIGAGLGLDLASQLIGHLDKTGCSFEPGEIAVMDAGGLDLLTHLGNTELPRINMIQQGLERVAGRTVFWGLQSPRPAEERLKDWPFDLCDLKRRFDRFEREMGIPEPVPLSGRTLDAKLIDILKTHFLGFRGATEVREVRPAPVAVGGGGHRWSAADCLGLLRERGVTLIPHARCQRLESRGKRVDAVHGVWLGNRPFVIRPQLVVIAVGAENVLPLLQGLLPKSADFQPADHIRIDLSGWLEPGRFGGVNPEELGISLQNMVCRAQGSEVGYHLEVKAAPTRFWRRYMPSGDNLQAGHEDSRILVQVQAIAQMHTRLPVASLVRDGLSIHADMTLRDLKFQHEIGQLMDKVGTALGLSDRPLRVRPLLTNHHLYGVLRIGKGLTRSMSIENLANCYVLSPSSYVCFDDDSNPLLKSRVLNSFVADSIAHACWSVPSSCNSARNGQAVTASPRDVLRAARFPGNPSR